MSSIRLLAIPVLALASLTACGSSDDAGEAPAAAEAAPTEKVDANTASAEELQAIPGVGEKIADEILEYRPYDAETGEAKFREELAKYISEDEIDRLVTYLSFG